MLQWTTPLPTAVDATSAQLTKPANDLQNSVLQGQMTVVDGLHQMVDLVDAVLG